MPISDKGARKLAADLITDPSLRTPLLISLAASLIQRAVRIDELSAAVEAMERPANVVPLFGEREA